jgi:hypothetical protein
MSDVSQHRALELLAKGMEPLGIFTPIPWIFPILYNIPGLGAGIQEFIDFGDAQVAARKQVRHDCSQGLTVLTITVLPERARAVRYYELVN